MILNKDNVELLADIVLLFDGSIIDIGKDYICIADIETSNLIIAKANDAELHKLIMQKSKELEEKR